MYVLRIALFFAIVLVVVVGGHLYLYRRLFRDTTSDAAHPPRRAPSRSPSRAPRSSSPGRCSPASTRRGATRWPSPPGAGWGWASTWGCRSPPFTSGGGWTAGAGGANGAAAVSTERRQFLARAAVGGAGLVTAGFSAYGVRRAFAAAGHRRARGAAAPPPPRLRRPAHRAGERHPHRRRARPSVPRGHGAALQRAEAGPGGAHRGPGRWPGRPDRAHHLRRAGPALALRDVLHHRQPRVLLGRRGLVRWRWSGWG